eukprot:scaffold101816_cov29-Tisochrysis_lutea.AAC.6
MGRPAAPRCGMRRRAVCGAPRGTAPTQAAGRCQGRGSTSRRPHSRGIWVEDTRRPPAPRARRLSRPRPRPGPTASCLDG